MNDKERVREYAVTEGLTVRSRRRDKVYRRVHLAMYLNQIGVSYFESAEILGLMGRTDFPDHATIKYYVEVLYPNYCNDELFLELTMQEFDLFPIDGQGSGLSLRKLVVCKLTDDQYKKLSIIRLKGNFKTNKDALLSLL